MHLTLQMPNMSQGKDFKALFHPHSKIIITSHHKPDADALGSSLALLMYLEKLGHQCSVISPSDYPAFLYWMKGHERVINYEDKALRAKADQAIAEADWICCLDFNRLNRTHEMEQALRQSKARKVLIDHHLDKENFADFEYYDTNASATCELIYRLICDQNDHLEIDISMGECLYAGIMTDTGSFRHACTTPLVHRIAAELMEIGVNTNQIHRWVYDNSTEERLQFLGYILKEKLKVIPEYHTAYIAITSDELKAYRSQTGDTEGFVNYALSIEHVKMAVILIDRGEMVKISFRSVDDINVNNFAQQFFEGGGHKNAAGGKSTQSLEKTVERLINALPQLKELKTTIH